ncbi:response regulator transcription factor [Nocardiopsis baichengensis]|uniref:response regulator transcription factor n=1 Tax=Nocardiopsis baichengensis TaxID=280240 RepID=UPI00034C4C43|nr:response regulator transcription factor [Nocardiopsis baichengensis]
MTAEQTIRVFLVDDHDIVRRGVGAMIEKESDMEVVGEAADASGALARIPAVEPDVALLDVRLPDGSGVEVCRDLRSRMPGLACLMLTSYADDDALYQSVMAGASGYVLKQIHGGDLLGAIRTVAAGESLLDPRSTARILRRMREEAEREDPLAALSDKERSIFEQIGEGLTNRQIGERVFLSEKTVKNYVSSILSKLQMQRRTQAAVYAAQLKSEESRGGGTY